MLWRCGAAPSRSSCVNHVALWAVSQAASLPEWYHLLHQAIKANRLRPIDHAFLLNYARKKMEIPKRTSVLMKALSEMLQIQLPAPAYETIQSLTGIDSYRTSQRGRSADAIQFFPGINDSLKQKAAERFGDRWVINMGDGTRAARSLEEYRGFLVGTVFPPDPTKWPTEPGLPIPVGREDLEAVTDVDDGTAYGGISVQMA